MVCICDCSAAISGRSSGASVAARNSRATALAVGPAGITQSPPATASTTCTDLHDSSSTDQLSSWRCATYLQGGQPQQLQSQQLGTASSRRLLAANEVVLLRGIQLATCRLADGVRKQTDASSSSSSAVAAQPGSTSHSSGQHGEVQVLCSPADTNRFIAAGEARGPHTIQTANTTQATYSKGFLSIATCVWVKHAMHLWQP
jgi:hypothetical protein